jgi:hypothetical protein
MFILKPKPKLFAETSTKPAIEPIPYEFKEHDACIATFDTETDRFEYEKHVQPFTCHFSTFEEDTPEQDREKFQYTTTGGSAGNQHAILHVCFWGRDCIDQFFEWLSGLEGRYIVYCHNFGNFDAYFCLDYIDRGSAPFIINGRLAKLKLQGVEFRDSYSLIPVALETAAKGAANKKTTFKLSPLMPDEIAKECMYNAFVDTEFYRIDTRECIPTYEAWREEICYYQEDDCVALLFLVMEAYNLFGDRLTMASIALPMLRSYHGFEPMTEKIDTEMRPYYFGGRCQCFEVGRLEGDWKIYDVNSMYPFVMANVRHPVSATPRFEDRITERTNFAHIRAWSDGALPVRSSDGGLAFPRGNGDFYASIHEIKAGLDTGTLRISKVYSSTYFDETTTFDTFVNEFYGRRQQARADGDEIKLLYWKLVLNSSYGKLAQDPRRYENYLFDPDEPPKPWKCSECDPKSRAGDRCPSCQDGSTSPFGWSIHTDRESEVIYSRPSNRGTARAFYNVAAAASITGAARAYLLRAIVGATRPIYCDTDSLICEAIDQPLHNSQLGAWKLEAQGNLAAIGGKKLYAVFNDGEAIKSASKGVKLTPREIERVCAGEVIEYAHPVPKFKLSGDTEFTKRTIRATGVV